MLGVGVACLAAGGAIRTWASRTLGRDFLVRLDLRDEHRLVESGPFRHVRHPTYAALLLMAIGTGLCFGSPLALAATALLWIPAMAVRVGREERQLAARYGRVYEEYRHRTWRLVPGLDRPGGMPSFARSASTRAAIRRFSHETRPGESRFRRYIAHASGEIGATAALRADGFDDSRRDLVRAVVPLLVELDHSRACARVRLPPAECARFP